MGLLSAKFTILIYYLMVSYFYSFNPFVGINETGKNFSLNNLPTERKIGTPGKLLA